MVMTAQHGADNDKQENRRIWYHFIFCDIGIVLVLRSATDNEQLVTAGGADFKQNRNH